MEILEVCLSETKRFNVICLFMLSVIESWAIKTRPPSTINNGWYALYRPLLLGKKGTEDKRAKR